MIVIEINKLCKKYNKNFLFDHFDLSVEENQLTAIVGVSGSGKSTLLNMIGGLENYNQGEIKLWGKDLNTYSHKEKQNLYAKDLGFLFQNYALIENETVLENLIIPIRKESKQEQQRKIEEVLNTVGLLDKLHVVVNTLSGGEQQRIALARLLLKTCRIVLADEPTGNLDEINKNIIFGILKEMKKEKTVLIVTHDKDLASQCDKVITLS